jgi:iron complex outermembrane recepter protein
MGYPISASARVARAQWLIRAARNFQGVTLDARSGQTTRGDGNQTQISALLGSNFADDKGNAIIGLTVSKREEIFSRDRDFFAEAYTDPGTPGATGFPTFGGFANTGTYTQAAADNVFGAKRYQTGDVPNSSILYFNTAPTVSQATRSA